MADSDLVTLGKLYYFCREKYYKHVQTAALEGLRKYGNDPILKYFNALGLILEGHIQEGMRDLEVLKDKGDVSLCSMMALIYAHKLGKSTDREAVQELEARIKDERKKAGEKELYFAGMFFYQSGKVEKGKEYIDKLLSKFPNSREGLILRGWIEIALGKDPMAKKSMQYFNEATAVEGPRDPEIFLGKARCLELRRNYSGALDSVNQAVVSFQNYLPALIEKMKLQLALRDWDQVMDIAERALMVDSNCIEAHRHLILQKLCREGDYTEAASETGHLLGILDRLEPKNAYLYCNIAQVFSRICGRNRLMLQQTMDLAERAVNVQPGDADYVNEVAYQHFLKGNHDEATRLYRMAMTHDETSVTSLTGIIRGQLASGNLEEAASQLDFLQEMRDTIGKTSELSYLSAVLAKKRNKSPEAVSALLVEAVETHFAAMKYVPLSNLYYYSLNPDFLLLLVNDFLEYAPQQPTAQGQPPSDILKRCSMVLEPITQCVPGLLEVLFLMGKVKYLMGDIDSAQTTLQHCLDQDSAFSDAHILMAQIYLSQSNFKMANQSLEVGLSYNFEVREHPLYHLIKARIQMKQGDYEEAKKTLLSATQLPGVMSLGGRKSSGRKKTNVQLSVNERVSVFLDLAEVHGHLGEQPEAAKVMQDAIHEFHGTPEEVRIGIANADLALGRGDVEGALTVLRGITPEQAYYIEARKKMAEIYLTHRKDQRLYASCYKELVDKLPSAQTYLLLGDAYMSIQEPENAITTYEIALKRYQRDFSIASKIGKALVRTHNYDKAINYYKAALHGGQTLLRLDLAELLLKLRRYDTAEKTLRAALDAADGDGEGESNELESMMRQTSYLLLLSKVHHSTGRTDDSMLSLTKAKEMQARILKRVAIEQPDVLTTQKQLAASICSRIGKHYAEQRDFEKAVRCYQEALGHDSEDGKLGLDLANLYLMTEDLDSCQHQLVSLLKGETENDAASVMMADLMFRKNDYDQAMFHFQQLLSRKPDHWEALSRLIDLMRRAGKLDECQTFLDAAEEANPNADLQPGYNFCKGLYKWRTGDINGAITYFNMARKDTDWGQEVLYHMIEICLNPDNNTVGGEVLSKSEGGEGADQQHGPASSAATEGDMLGVSTASKLLKDLKPVAGDIRAVLLENMVLLSSKNKLHVERALQSFTELAQEYHDHVGALYGTAAAYMVSKQAPKARNQLKRLAKNVWNLKDAEDLEKSWLLLADLYIQSGKSDIATELLNKVLQYNKSCCKAYEYMGLIMEKEQAYKDAAKNYELAWKYGNKSNPSIGYKLGFNFVKAKRYVEAIDIAHHVLDTNSNYPKIRKDVLDKARHHLRT